MKATITVTAHEAREWARLATAAYARGDDDTAHRMSVASVIYEGRQIDVMTYDRLMKEYRVWLIAFGAYVTPQTG